MQVQNKNMYPKRSVRKFAWLCGSSVFLLVLGIVVICIRTLLYNTIINKMLMLQPGSQTFEIWKKTPVPLTFKIHFFNWTNPTDIYNNTIKPIFRELGPYTFDESKEKVNITWNENNTVSYYNLKKWWFNANVSNGSLSDPITSISPVALSTAVAAKNWSFLFKRGLNILLGSVSSKVYITKPAGELLFEGTEDSLLTMVNSMPSFGSEAMPQFDKFGWFYSRNGSETYEGNFNMDTGISGRLGELHSWKYMKQTPYNSEHCGKVGGSAGEFFPIELKKDSIIKFFNADLCRYVELEFEKEVVVSGILGYKFSAQDRFLDNGTRVSRNKCFCKDNCMPSGALDVSSCRYGSPAFVSLPHFLKADPYYLNMIDGLNPNNNTHDFFMIFEPKTGLPLHVSAKLQLNLLLQPVSGIRIYENAPKIYIPVLWFEQTVVIPDDAVCYITILINFEVICLTIGIIMIFLALCVKICCWYSICSANMFKSKTESKTNVIHREKEPLAKFRDISI